MEDIQAYKKELINSIQIGAETEGSYAEIEFLEHVYEIISEAGLFDNIESPPGFRDKNKGMKIDGLAMNQTEEQLIVFVSKFSNDADELTTIAKSEIETLGKQCAKFLENYDDKRFVDALADTSNARSYIEIIEDILNNPEVNISKYRVVVVTDCVLSDRVKDPSKLELININGMPSAFEIIDLKRLMAMEYSSSATEPITINFEDYSPKGGISALSANISEGDTESYMCVMPGEILSELFHDYGQRLLEGNVRTFLTFRGNVNKGMRTTLLKSPEDFFAYNNGLTVTASAIKTKETSQGLLITSMDDMQIVNGGQTTSTIYFSPRQKGRQANIDFTSIDLSKVFVQMKLSVIKNNELMEEMKANIAEFANTQNPIQKSDLVSNHPFHKRLEDLSRKTIVPSGDRAVATKWFYERAKGQYQTKLLSILGKSKKDKFVMENPKDQLFTKTDMAKFENTWRMNPSEVMQGAQKNLTIMGQKILKEYEDNENNFEAGFYRNLISKAILFRQTEKAISATDWYQQSKGYRADTTCYTLALFRFLLIEDKKDINLKRIYDAQKLSDSLIEQILMIAKEIRSHLLDESFRDGIANPSMFSKKASAFDKYKKLNITLKNLNDKDYLVGNDVQDQEVEEEALNEVSADVSVYEQCMQYDEKNWAAIYQYMKDHKIIKKETDRKLVEKLTIKKYAGTLRFPQDYEICWKLRQEALNHGFIDPD